MYETKNFSGIIVGVQKWKNNVCWITMRGEANGLTAAFNAGVYFWRLVSEVSREYDGTKNGVMKWLFDETDRPDFNEGYKNTETFLLNGGKTLRATLQNGSNEVYGPYTRVGFMLKENEG